MRWTPIGTGLVALIAPDFLAAPSLAILLGFFPGYILLRGLRLAPAWSAGGRVVLAVAFSLVVTPILLDLLWRVPFTPATRALIAAIVIQAFAFWVLRREWDGANAQEPLAMFESRWTRAIAGCVAVAVVVATIGPYWPRRMGDWIAPCAIHDFIKHHAVMSSIGRGGLPLDGPFFAAGESGPVYYYHYFYLIPATIRSVTVDMSIELAFAIQSAAVALSLAGTVYCVVKRISRSDAKATLAMLLATVVGGLDVLMLLVMRLPVVTLDAWADHSVRVHNLLNQMMWSPQNVQGLLVGLIGAYLLGCKGWWRGWWWCGPLLCLALIGSSVWVAIPLVAGLFAFVVTHVVSQRGTRMRCLTQAAGVGALCILVCWPTIGGYMAMSRRLGESLTTDWPRQSHALLGRLLPPGPLANLLDLPWIVLVEFGALAVLPALLSRRQWKMILADSGMRLLAFSAAAALVGFILVRSHFDYNDFGQKSMMVALLFAAVAGGFSISSDHLSRWNPTGWQLDRQLSPRLRIPTRVVVGLCVVCGAAVAIYEAPLTAVRRYVDPDSRLSRLAAEDADMVRAERGAYLWMDRNNRPTDVVQADWSRRRLPLAQLSGTRFGVTELERDTKVFCPPKPTEHERILARFVREIETGADEQRLCDLLVEMNVTHVFVGLIEQTGWPRLTRFENPACFEPVYSDASVTIYEIIGENR